MEEDNEDSDGDLSLQAADEQVHAYTVVSLLLLLGCNVLFHHRSNKQQFLQV